MTMNQDSKPFDVVVIGSGYSFTHNRIGRGKSRFLQALMDDPRFSIRFAEELEKKVNADKFWFDEITDLPVAMPMKQKPAPYWRQGERW